MSSKRLFEFDCQCSVYRNNIRLQVTGEKGHLRKVVLSLTRKMNHQPPPSLGLKLKQTTLQYLFSRQQQKNSANTQNSKDSKGSNDSLIQEMNIYVKVYCHTDEIYCFDLDECQNLNESQINGSVFNLKFGDKIVSFYDCPKEILEQARNILIKYNIKKRQLILIRDQGKNSNQNLVPEVYSEPQISIQRPSQTFTSMQQLRMERRKAALPESEYILPSKQLGEIKAPVMIKLKEIKKIALPEIIWNSIFKFVDKKSLFRLRLVDKFFNQTTTLMIKRLSFSQHNEIPLPVVVRCFAKFKNLESIVSGPMKNIKPHQIIQMRILPLRSLINLNLQDYIQLNDKLLEKIIVVCERITKLTLPYNSKITNNSINFISKKLQHLIYFKLVEKEKGLINEEISYQSVVKLIKTRRLNYLKIPILYVDFFEQFTILQKIEPFPSINGKLKIGTISFTQLRPNLIQDFTRFIESNNAITKMSISDFTLKMAQFNKYTCLFDDLTFMSFKDIFYFSFGGFVDDDFCKKLCQNNIEIKRLKIRSKLITDQGLKHIFFYCKNLERIDVAFCSMISGVGFQNLDDQSMGLSFPRLEVHVSLDDYNIQCLDDLLLAKAYNYKLTNQKIQKKK